MATQISTWQIIDGKLRELSSSLTKEKRTESYDLEKWIESNPQIIGPDILLIGRQVTTSSGKADLLGIDSDGNVVIIELKRDLLPREALAQAIDYTSDISSWDISRISEACAKYTGKDLEDLLVERFPDINVEEMNVNETQRIILIGFSIESSLERMITWLSANYNLNINALILSYIKTKSGDELISKTAIISEQVEKEKLKKKKFKILMSDEPGEYDEDELKKLVIKYLKQDLWSARRIQNVLLPACLEYGLVSREKLKEEFVRKEKAKSTNEAAYFVMLISTQMGMAKNDFLRQIISYEYPQYEWEKDNYEIREGYEPLVKEILAELNDSETGS